MAMRSLTNLEQVETKPKKTQQNRKLRKTYKTAKYRKSVKVYFTRK